MRRYAMFIWVISAIALAYFGYAFTLLFSLWREYITTYAKMVARAYKQIIRDVE